MAMSTLVATEQFFSFDPVTNTHLKLIDFNQANGASPVCTLIQANNGKLYGTTYLGGLSYYLGDPGAGTIFLLVLTVMYLRLF